MYSGSAAVYGAKHQVRQPAKGRECMQAQARVHAGAYYTDTLCPSLSSRDATAQTRCLAAVLGDQERHRFLVGSSSLRDANEVRARDV